MLFGTSAGAEEARCPKKPGVKIFRYSKGFGLADWLLRRANAGLVE